MAALRIALGAGLLLLVAVLVAACGGGTTTVTTPQTTAATMTSTTSSAEVLTPVGGISVQAVLQCFSDAGADIQGGTKKIGAGTGFFAILPNGTYSGMAVAPNGAVAKGLAKGLSSQPGYEVNTTSDPNALIIFKGSVDDQDRQIASDCVSQATD